MQVRKAYKKSSLRFHPDKAMSHCKFAASLGPNGAALADFPEVESRYVARCYLAILCHALKSAAVTVLQVWSVAVWFLC